MRFKKLMTHTICLDKTTCVKPGKNCNFQEKNGKIIIIVIIIVIMVQENLENSLDLG